MNRPKLRGRVPDAITRRLPGGERAAGEAVTDEPAADGIDADAGGSGSRRLPTLLTLAGLGLATLGVALRYVLDRRTAGDADADDREGLSREPDAQDTVEIVGDTDTAGTADVTERDGPTDGSETTAGGSETAADEPDDSPSAAVTGTKSDVTVRTFDADRVDEEDGESDDDAEPDGPPRIAPLVGMVALVGIRLFVDRVRRRYADTPAEAAPQL
jgi:hypothetical protein